MLKQLNTSQAERVRSAYSKLPLYMAVECAYTPLLAKMDTTDIDVEAVFTASSHLLDDLLTVSIVSQDQVDQYWSNMLVGARRMSKEVSRHDAAVVVYTVFCVVTAALIHHWHSYYQDTLRELLQSTLEREATEIDSDDKHMTNLRLAMCAEQMSEWMNDYADDEYALLSDDVDAAISGTSASSKKPGSGRKKQTVSTIRATFTYKPKDMSEREINVRLGLVFRELKKNRYIHADTDQQTFLSLFQGAPLDTKMIWTAPVNALCYFFRQLFSVFQYADVPVGYGFWQVVAAHFLDGKEQSLDHNKLRTTTGRPTNTKELDNIVSLFDPQLLNLNALQDLYRHADSDTNSAVQEYYKGSGLSIKNKR